MRSVSVRFFAVVSEGVGFTGRVPDTFVAWLSLLDGRVVFESFAQLPAGPSAPIEVSGLGEKLPLREQEEVWTGTRRTIDAVGGRAAYSVTHVRSK